MKKKWYALYVKSRTEKKVAKELERSQIEYYLPLLKLLKQWSDRKKWVEEPLFRSYIFVNISDDEYYKALQITGAVRYITFGGKAVVVPYQQIEAIKYFLNEKDPENYLDHEFKKGESVEIMGGSLSGLIGKLVEVKGRNMVSVEIEALNRTILIRIPKSRLRLIQ